MRCRSPWCSLAKTDIARLEEKLKSLIKLPPAMKMRLGRAVSSTLRQSRRLVGADQQSVLCRRGGLTWDLDLREIIDLYIYLTGSFERSTSQAIARNLVPGMVALDIGANVGVHALPMARNVGPQGHVYAIEPTDFAFQKLSRNLELNPLLRASLTPIKAALGEAGDAPPDQLYSSWSLAETSGHPIHAGQLRSITNGEFLTLDALVERLSLRALDFVKMDVDGHECKVLRGGRRTIERFHPRIVLELCPYVLEEHGHSLAELLDLLGGRSYQLHSLDGASRLPTEASALERLIPKGGGINALALPKPGFRG
jgi:FkbM family methyltransferase